MDLRRTSIILFGGGVEYDFREVDVVDEHYRRGGGNQAVGRTTNAN